MKLLSLKTTFLLAASNAFAIPLDLQDLQAEFQNPFGLNTLPGLDKPIPGHSPILLCDLDQPKLVEIIRIDLDPNPPVKGQNVTIHAEGIVKQPILEGAYVDVDVRYGYIRLLKQTFDLCEQSKTVGIECPVEKGKLVLDTSVEIPGEVPPGKYVVFARAYTVDDEPITCLTGSIVFT